MTSPTAHMDPPQMFRSYKFLLRPTSRQAALLGECLEDMRELYNAALEERREAWRMGKHQVTYYSQGAQLKEIRAADPGRPAPSRQRTGGRITMKYFHKESAVEAVRWTGDNLADVQALAPGQITLAENTEPPSLLVRRPSEEAFSIPFCAWVIRWEATGRINFYASDEDFRSDYEPMPARSAALQFELKASSLTVLAREIVRAMPAPDPVPCYHAVDVPSVTVRREDLRLYFGSLAGSLTGGELAQAEGARRRLRDAAGL